MKSRFLLILLMCLVKYETGNAQATFTTLYDTVYGNAFQCNALTASTFAGYYKNRLVFTPGTTLNISWHVAASNFPANWLPQLVFIDTANNYFNTGPSYPDWNGSSGLYRYDLFAYPSGSFLTLELYETSLTAGTYWLEVNLKDSASGYSKNIWYVIANEPAMVGNVIEGPSGVCAGKSITLTDKTVISPVWTASNGDATVAGGVVTGVASGTDTISYSGYFMSYNDTNAYPPTTLMDSCPINITATKTVLVYSLVTPVVSGSGSMLYTTAGYLSYQWTDAGVPILGATNDTYSPASDGSYSVIITDSNGCMDTSSLVFDNNVGVPPVSAAGSNIRVYPNPASSEVYIDAPVPVHAILTELNGGIVLENDNATKINVSDIANGTYLLSLYDKNGTKLKTEKIVKTGN